MHELTASSEDRLRRIAGVFFAAASVGSVFVHVLLWRLLFGGWFAGIAAWAILTCLAAPVISAVALGLGSLEPTQPLVRLAGGISLIFSVLSLIGLFLALFLFARWVPGSG